MSKYPQLDEYVKKTREQGFDDEVIKNKILSSGYTQEHIDEVFDLKSMKQTLVTVKEDVEPVINTVQEVGAQEQIKQEPKIQINLPKKDIFDQSAVANSEIKTDYSDVKITEDPMPSRIGGSVPSISRSTQSIENSNVTKASNLASVEAPKSKKGLIVGILLLIMILIGGGVYAYMNDINPFGNKGVYSEDNFLTNVFSKLSTIDSANYIFFTKAYIEDREPNVPLFPESKEMAELESKYQRDVKRIALLNNINSLNMYTDTYLYPNSLNFSKVQEFKEMYDIEDSIFEEILPTYKSINSGKGYEVTIAFETDEAIKSFEARQANQMTNFAPVSKVDIKINRRNMFISNPEGELKYLRIEYSLPKTFTQEYYAMISRLSPDFKVDGQFDFKGKETVTGLDLALNIMLSGDMGDLTYKFSADVIREQKDIFIKLNNFPSILSDFVPIQKGQWILLSEKDISNNFIASPEDVSESMDELDKIKNNVKEIFIEGLKIANNQKIITFAHKPARETIDNQKTYRYSLKIDETKAIPYIVEVINFIKTKKDLELDDMFIKDLDEFLVAIQDPQFAQEIRYLIANSTYVVWIDSQGYPIKMESRSIIVPSATNKNLINKQFVTESGFLMKNINQAIEISKPSEYTTIEEVMESMFSF